MCKPVDVVNTEDVKRKVSDVKVVGDPDMWQLIAKASSKSQGWMKSTKVMEIEGVGVVIQVSTETKVGVAEALEFVPGVKLEKDENDNYRLVKAEVNELDLSIKFSWR